MKKKLNQWKPRANPQGLMGSATREHRDKTLYRRKEKHKGKGWE